MGLLGGWVRFWYRGELLPLPAELQQALDEARNQVETQKRRAEQERQRAEQEKQRADQLQRLVEQERQARLATERELERLRSGQRPP